MDSNNKYIIILNGDSPKNIDEDFFKGKRVICADGAYDYFSCFKIKAFAVIGDMDSVKADYFDAYNIVKFPKDKDKTDGQLSIEYAIKCGAKDITIIGASGRRDDHYIANIGLLMLAYKNNIEARIFTDYNEIYYFEKHIEIDCPKNKYFSIVPFCKMLHIISTEGLKYEICRKTLKAYNSLGISNETTANKVSITASRGAGLAILSFEDVK